MEKISRLPEIKRLFIGKIKKNFINTAECYAIYTHYFLYRGETFNYIAVTAEKNGAYDLDMGLWFDQLDHYIEKTAISGLTEQELNLILKEVAEGFKN